MRLIDADALIADHCEGCNYMDTHLCSLDDPVCGAVECIVDAPTIDAVEVVHGRWERANNRPKSYIRKCSICGKEAYFCGTGCGYKYCPNCGAKMDGKE